MPPKKKPKKKAPKKKPVVTILPTNNIVFKKNYSDLIVGPRGVDFASIRNEINEYEKALDGKPSTVVLTATPPFGNVYFHPTGEKCIYDKTGETVQRFTVIDAYKKDITLIQSAERDFNNVGKITGLSRKCVPVTIKTMNAEGKSGKETQFVSITESKNISPDIRMKESMDNMKTDLENELDGGQQIFIGSAVVLGLYLFYKVLYKR
jgi:polygalacturonase